MEREKLTINIGLIVRIVLIAIIALFIGFVIVFVVKIQIDGREALRQAKNVKLALRSADIQMYGKNKTIFDPTDKNGLESGTSDLVNELYTPPGKYYLTSYDSKKHELTGFVYQVGRYTVTFRQDSKNIHWDVDLRYTIYSYDEDTVNGE